jgi:hypothetical protein
MAADKQRDQLVLIGRRRLGKLQHVTAHLQAHPAVGSPAAREPPPDGSDNRAQASGTVAKTHQQPAYGGHIECPTARCRVTYPERGHILDVKVQEFLAKEASQRGQPLSIRPFLGQLQA